MLTGVWLRISTGLSETVWITRNSIQGLFNAYSQSYFDGMDHTEPNGDGVQQEWKTDTNTQTGRML